MAGALWALHAWTSPGSEFQWAYRWLVQDPNQFYAYGQFNPPWLAIILAPFISLPGRAGYVVFQAATLVMLMYSARVLGGRPIPLLLSAQVFWIMWWAQVEAVVTLGVALAVVGARRQSWVWVALGAALAVTKPHVGLAPAAVLWWQSGPSRWKSLCALAALFGGSLVVWGPWPLWVLENTRQHMASFTYGGWNASLGLAALPLFVPALLLPLTPKLRLLAVTCTALLVSPYMPFYSTVIVLCFSLPPYLYPLAFIGYLPTVVGTVAAWNSVALLPLGALVWVYWPVGRDYVRGWWTKGK